MAKRKRKMRKLPAVFQMAPKKPNSARRWVCRVSLLKPRKRVFAYIRGIGHTIQEFNHVMIHGGRIKDLIGMKYRLIRGRLDFYGLYRRRTQRSLYGTKKSYMNRYDWRELPGYKPKPQPKKLQKNKPTGLQPGFF